MNKIVFLLCVLIASSFVLRGQEFVKLLSFEVCTDNQLFQLISNEKYKYSSFDTIDDIKLCDFAWKFKDLGVFKKMQSQPDSISSACFVFMYAFAIEYYLELGWKPYYDHKNEYCGQDVVWGDIPEPCFQKGLLSSIYFVSQFRRKMHKRITHEELSELVYNVLQGGIFKHPEVIMDVLLNFDFEKASRDANERRR